MGVKCLYILQEFEYNGNVKFEFNVCFEYYAENENRN